MQRLSLHVSPFVSYHLYKLSIMKSSFRIALGKLGGRERGLADFARALRDAGMEVIYLGVRQTSESFISAVEQEDADAVAIALDSADQLAEIALICQSLRSAGLDTPVIVGGDVDAGAAQELRSAGIAAVVAAGASSQEVAEQVREAVGGGTAGSGMVESGMVESGTWGDGAADANDLLEKARSGSSRALGRLLSILEQSGAASSSAMFGAGAENSATGGAESPGGSENLTGSKNLGGSKTHAIGIIGVPGSGKSTLIGRLTEAASGKIRSPGRPKRSDAPPPKIAVIALDPSSGRSGGAVLGDRVRMTSSMQKPQSSVGNNIFFRSAASRGESGGAVAWLPDAVKLFAAAGFDLIFVEASDGRPEAVADIADTFVAVVTADCGDAVQASKAGMLEFADIFAVNKADSQDASSISRDLERMLDMGFESSWRPPVVPTAATSREGTADLWSLIEAHRIYGN